MNTNDAALREMRDVTERERHSRLMDKAYEVAGASNCTRRQVGAVIVKNSSVLISASNGTPDGCTPCDQGGCARCQSEIASGEAYDTCICMHAEQRAIASAASTGTSTAGATMYVTLRPCLPCLNLCLHAGIATVIYFEELTFDQRVEEAYAQFVENTRISLRRTGEPGI